MQTNDGGNLSEEITYNSKLNNWWQEIAVMLAKNYDALGGKVGRHSMRVLID